MISCGSTNNHKETTDDEGDRAPPGRHCASPAGPRGRLSAERRGALAAPADGGGSGSTGGRGALRAQRGAVDLPQRLPSAALGDPCGPGDARDPAAAGGQLPAELFGAAAAGGAGAGLGGPGSLRVRGLHPQRGRPGACPGRLGDRQERGEPDVQGARRGGRGVPQPAFGGGSALRLAGRGLREGARGRAGRSGRTFCVVWCGGASRAASWSSPTPTRAFARRSRRCCRARAGSAAGCTRCARS